MKRKDLFDCAAAALLDAQTEAEFLSEEVWKGTGDELVGFKKIENELYFIIKYWSDERVTDDPYSGMIGFYENFLISRDIKNVEGLYELILYENILSIELYAGRLGAGDLDYITLKLEDEKTISYYLEQHIGDYLLTKLFALSQFDKIPFMCGETNRVGNIEFFNTSMCFADYMNDFRNSLEILRQ